MDLHTGATYVMDEAWDYSHIMDPYDQESINISFGVFPWTTGPQGDYLPLVLDPLKRVLLHTTEVVEVPLESVGLVQLRSTFARMGLMIPSTYADAGFKGTLTMEVFNSSIHRIRIHPGMHMWNMVIVPAHYELAYGGRYMDQGNNVVMPRAIARPE